MLNLNSLKKNILLDGFKVLCTVGEKEKDIEKNIEFRLPSPPLYFRVTIKNTKAKDDDEIDRKEKVYIFSLYDKWEDDEIKKQFDNNCRENRLKLLEKMQSQIIEGKQYKRFSLEQRNSDSKIRQEKSKYNINKVYIHEELIRLKQNMADEDSFIQALDELKFISEMLLEEKQVDDKQTRLKETIDKLLRYKRGRR